MKKFTPDQVRDLTAIMGIEQEMLSLLPLFRPKNHLLSPWENELPRLFKNLRLKKGDKVLDVPCGQGGVSVPLAQKYGVHVTGYDLVPEYVKYAKTFTKKMGVEKLCSFAAADVRSVVRKKNIYDLFIWAGAPHVWGGTKATVRALAKPVRDGGLIFMADAYLHAKTRKTGIYKNYDYLRDLKNNLTARGDEILFFHDYENTLWDHDRKMVYEEILSAFKNAKTKKENDLLVQLQENLKSVYHSRKYEIGLFVAVIRKRERG